MTILYIHVLGLSKYMYIVQWMQGVFLLPRFGSLELKIGKIRKIDFRDLKENFRVPTGSLTLSLKIPLILYKMYTSREFVPMINHNRYIYKDEHERRGTAL